MRLILVATIAVLSTACAGGKPPGSTIQRVPYTDVAVDRHLYIHGNVDVCPDCHRQPGPRM